MNDSNGETALVRIAPVWEQLSRGALRVTKSENLLFFSYKETDNFSQ